MRIATPPPALWILCVVLLLFNNPATSHAQDASEHRAVLKASDGVEIAYTEQGDGELALVFLHCWACNQQFWQKQVEAFSEDYRVVTLDFPGHGISGAEREKWSVGGYSEDVKVVVESLDLTKVILIGHSMGGPVALASYPLLADRVIAVIAVESLHDVEVTFPKAAVEAWAEMMEADFEGSIQKMVKGMFADSGNPEQRDWVTTQAIASDHEAMIALIRSYSKVDLKTWLAATKVPVRAINAAPHPPGIQETKTESNQKYGDFDAVTLDGVGHFLILERPEDFNELLAQELAKILGTDSETDSEADSGVSESPD